MDSEGFQHLMELSSGYGVHPCSALYNRIFVLGTMGTSRQGPLISGNSLIIYCSCVN